jgi:hypothetical protein
MSSYRTWWAACRRRVQVESRQCTHLNRVTICGLGTSEAALALCRPRSPVFLLPAFLLPRPVFRRTVPGDTPVILRCISDVDSKIPSVCSPFTSFSAFRALAAAFASYSFRIEYCWPVSLPDWARRRRLRNFSPTAIKASRCACVIDLVYFCEAALNRARQRNCIGVRGSRGLT